MVVDDIRAGLFSGPLTEPPAPTGSAFDSSIGNLRTSLRDANAALDDLRAKLDSVPS